MKIFFLIVAICFLQVAIASFIPLLSINLPLAAIAASITALEFSTSLILASALTLFTMLMSYNSHIAWLNIAAVLLSYKFYPEQLSNKVLVCTLLISAMTFIDLFFIRGYAHVGQTILEFISNIICSLGILYLLNSWFHKSKKHVKYRR